MAAFALSRSGSRAPARGADRPASRGADRVSSREGGTSAGRQVSGAAKGGEGKPGTSRREYAGATGWFQGCKGVPSQGDGRRGEYPLGESGNGPVSNSTGQPVSTVRAELGGAAAWHVADRALEPSLSRARAQVERL